jgi:hypothetical protein
LRLEIQIFSSATSRIARVQVLPARRELH